MQRNSERMCNHFFTFVYFLTGWIIVYRLLAIISGANNSCNGPNWQTPEYIFVLLSEHRATVRSKLKYCCLQLFNGAKKSSIGPIWQTPVYNCSKERTSRAADQIDKTSLYNCSTERKSRAADRTDRCSTDPRDGAT